MGACVKVVTTLLAVLATYSSDVISGNIPSGGRVNACRTRFAVSIPGCSGMRDEMTGFTARNVTDTGSVGLLYFSGSNCFLKLTESLGVRSITAGRVGGSNKSSGGGVSTAVPAKATHVRVVTGTATSGAMAANGRTVSFDGSTR